MTKPSAAKAVHIIFSIGPEDESTMDQFVEGIKLAVSHAYSGKTLGTKLYGEYQHDGRRYKELDWEKWDGSPDTKPKDRYTYEPRAVAVRPVLPQKTLTSSDVRKALDVHREALGQRPLPVASDAEVRPVESLSGPLTTWPHLPGWEYDPWEEVVRNKRRVIRRK